MTEGHHFSSMYQALDCIVGADIAPNHRPSSLMVYPDLVQVHTSKSPAGWRRRSARFQYDSSCAKVGISMLWKLMVK